MTPETPPAPPPTAGTARLNAHIEAGYEAIGENMSQAVNELDVVVCERCNHLKTWVGAPIAGGWACLECWPAAVRTIPEPDPPPACPIPTAPIPIATRLYTYSNEECRAAIEHHNGR